MELAAEWREKMIESIADFDDSIMETFLEGGEINEADLRSALRKGTIAGKVVPVLSGSSFKNKGVQAMLDAIVDFLPSPLDVGAVHGVDPKTEQEVLRNPSDTEPFCALAFKIMSDKYVGRLTYLRVYSGLLKKGSTVLVCYRDPQTNEFRSRSERVGRILQMHANHREDLDEADAGSIVGVIGLNDVHTGQTVCQEGKAVVLEAIRFPEPVIQIAIEPKSRADQEKLATSLLRLAQEDPTFRMHTDPESGQTIISGMGELHLEIIVDRLSREFGVQANQASRRSPIERPSGSRARPKGASFGKRAVRANMATAGSSWSRSHLDRGFNSRTRSSAERSRRSSFLRSRRACAKRRNPALWRAIPSST